MEEGVEVHDHRLSATEWWPVGNVRSTRRAVTDESADRTTQHARDSLHFGAITTSQHLCVLEGIEAAEDKRQIDTVTRAEVRSASTPGKSKQPRSSVAVGHCQSDPTPR